MKLLIIGSIWPEPASSAAGENMMNIITEAQKRQWDITFASAALDSVHAVDPEKQGIKKLTIALNSSSFDLQLEQIMPDIVIFDRFMTEEQFSWRVAKVVPDAIRILNSEDCHSLRQLRQKKLRFDSLSIGNNELVIREAAAIMRCDLSLIVSQFEINWITDCLSVPASQLILCPLLVNSETLSNKDYDTCRHISFIGNFKHAPNWDAVQHLRKLWPAIRKKLGNSVECHIYGAYPPKKATDLSSTKIGFRVNGWIDNADDAFLSYRLMAAPLNFGAGIKGKLLRSIMTLTPSVTTTIGIEGIAEESEWPGAVAQNDEQFIESVISLYTNREEWKLAKDKANVLAAKLAANNMQFSKAFDHIETTLGRLNAHRNQHFLSRVINHQTLRSHQYMSQWIEAKSKLLQS